MNKQMFVDESEDSFRDESEESPRILVVSGVLFDPDALDPFSREWREILPEGELRKQKRNTARAKKLYTRTIKYVLGVYDLIIPVDVYEEEFRWWAAESVLLENYIRSASPLCLFHLIHLGDWRRVSYSAFCSFSGQLLSKSGLAEPVDITFDEYRDRPFQDAIRQGYEFHRKTAPPEQQAVMGEPLKFANSKDSPHIQFADLWAWHRRKMVLETGTQDAEEIRKHNPVPRDWGGDPEMFCTYWDRTNIRLSFDPKFGQLIDPAAKIRRSP